MRAALLAFLWLTTLASGARAWSPLGHQAVAHLAERNLSSTARVRLNELLGQGVALASIATWADEIRKQRPETARWHFIDIENSARTRRDTIARFCPEHDCVVDQIELSHARLSNAALPPAERVEALSFLVHFVADLHQPLHCANDGDRGGNDKLLEVPGAENGSMKLHAFWDNLLSANPTDDPRELAARLDRRSSAEDRVAWARGSAADWAWESFQIARKVIYADFRHGRVRHPMRLPARYRSAEPRQIAEAQLARAGVRLAWLLNTALAR